MGRIFACCGHEVFGEEAFVGYVWKGKDCSEESLNYGNLCPECVDIYNAVEGGRGDYDKDKELLKGKKPVGLIEILAGQHKKPIRRENIGSISFDILEL